MKRHALLLASLLLPLLAAPAAGDIDVRAPPDRLVLLSMSGTSFNGAAYPETPLVEAAVGEVVQFTVLVPPLAEAHTFHLHGHPWRAPSKGGMVDTVLLRPGEVHSFTVVAGGEDRAAGDWMYHCHFDSHVAGGMWGVFRVYPYAATVSGAAPTFEVALDRMGAPVDGATLAVTLEGAPVAAHARALGEGRYIVHADLPADARGALAVTATHAWGKSVGRLALGGAELPTPRLTDAGPLPGGHGH